MAATSSKAIAKSSKSKAPNKVAKYFRGVWAELKKVHWPNKKELITYTLVVIASVFVVSMLIWVVDSIFSTILKQII